MKISEMIDAPVFDRDSDREMGSVTDALIDTLTGDIPYVLIDTSMGLGHAPVLVSRDRFTQRDGRWKVHISEEESLRSKAEADEQSTTPLDLSMMPPALVGPFGYTVSPVMASALINTLTGKSRKERPAIDQSHSDWFWFDTLHGLPLFDSSGSLGNLADVMVDPVQLACLSLVAQGEDRTLTTHDMGTLRHVTRDENSIILELSDPPPYSARAMMSGPS
ncbi:PRC-barrel domain-containing protein [Tateyamaria pelophila]|uniref:PRC-barrel domain-containing protein n=1 Tax=Tateyamaria pelophila TaxID=328415 RepID=UPI001CC08B71|nr:PRC-barrel domain-containing protein [Tateyamaria pelophila]